MNQIKKDLYNVDHIIERQMPYLCPDPTSGTDMLEEPSQSTPLSPGEQELRQATRQFCAAKSADTLRALLDLRITMQERTCALWVNS
jgi:hypothetical protein